MFSIIIPTFNNLKYLKLCIKSIKKNSKFNHEIIIHINEGIDGTLEYLKDKEFITSYSKKNSGVCVGFNKATALASKKYIVLAHDDMYFCPDWDVAFYDEIKRHPENKDFFVSGTMVQPFKSYLEFDCGKTLEEFDEEKLLKNVKQLEFEDYQGTHWQPSLIAKTTWDSVEGFSEEFSPGLGSDPDFNMKLWLKGVRIFKGLGNCRVYHFSSVSLRKKAWNNGAKTFLLKWGISIKFFKKHYLRSAEIYNGPLSEPKKNLIYYRDLLITKIKYYFSLLLSKSNEKSYS